MSGRPRCPGGEASLVDKPESGRPPLAPLEFEPHLVETVVRMVLDRGAAGVAPAALVRLRLSHRRELDRIYAQPAGEVREAAFRAHYRSLFGLLGFDRRLEGCLEIFPGLRRELREVLVRSVGAPEVEGAELWESRSQRGRGIPAYLVVSLTPRRFLDDSELARFLLPGLRRAADLLDPDFGAGLQGSDTGRGELGGTRSVRDTYRRLWDLSARARLVAAGHLEDAGLTAEVAEVAEVAGRDAGTLLRSLADSGAVSSPRLLTWAEELAGSAVEGADPGERCPLCSFPTLVWACPEALSAVEAEVREDYPGWRPADGCCEHCTDRYVGLASLRR